MHILINFNVNQFFTRLKKVFKYFLFTGVLSFVIIKRRKNNIRNNRLSEFRYRKSVNDIG